MGRNILILMMMMVGGNKNKDFNERVTTLSQLVLKMVTPSTI